MGWQRLGQDLAIECQQKVITVWESLGQRTMACWWGGGVGNQQLVTRAGLVRPVDALSDCQSLHHLLVASVQADSVILSCGQNCRL